MGIKSKTHNITEEFNGKEPGRTPLEWSDEECRRFLESLSVRGKDGLARGFNNEFSGESGERAKMSKGELVDSILRLNKRYGTTMSQEIIDRYLREHGDEDESPENKDRDGENGESEEDDPHGAGDWDETPSEDEDSEEPSEDGSEDSPEGGAKEGTPKEGSPNEGSEDGSEDGEWNQKQDMENDRPPSYVPSEDTTDAQYVTTTGAVSLQQLRHDSEVTYLGEHVNERSQYVDKALYQQNQHEKALTKEVTNLTKYVKHLETQITEGGAEIVIEAPGGGEAKRIESHTHPQFKKVLKEVRALKQVWLCGPAGTGKSTMCRHVAEALELPFGDISCSAGMSEAHILGRMSIDGSYLEAQFVNIYENGGVFLFDEVDNADANVMTVLNSALANGHLSLPNRIDKPLADRHPDCHIICASNTWGKGYEGGQDAIYVREMLDGAFRDRFVCAKTFIDYDKRFERKVTKEVPELGKFLWELRKRVHRERLEYVISTRSFEQGATLMMHEDYSLKDVSDNITIDWTKEEKAKVELVELVRDSEGTVQS